MLNVIRQFVKQDEGATAVEYGIMVSLIAIAIIVSVALVGGNLANVFTQVAGSLPS